MIFQFPEMREMTEKARGSGKIKSATAKCLWMPVRLLSGSGYRQVTYTRLELCSGCAEGKIGVCRFASLPPPLNSMVIFCLFLWIVIN